MRGLLYRVTLLAICGTFCLFAATNRADELPIPTMVQGATLPADAAMAVYVRPAELARSKSAAPIVEAFDAMLKPLKLGLSVAEVEEFKLVFLLDQQSRMEGIFMVLRARAAHDWKPMLMALGKWETDTVDGRTVFQNGRRNAFWLPDKRTAVIVEGRGDMVATLLAQSMSSPDPGAKAPWSKRWEEASRRPLAGLLDMRIVGGSNPANARGSMAVLAADGKFAVASGYFTIGGFVVEGSISTGSRQAAARVAPATSQALVEFAEDIIKELRLEDADQGDLADQFDTLLGNARVWTNGDQVHAAGMFDSQMIQVMSAIAKKVSQRGRQ